MRAAGGLHRKYVSCTAVCRQTCDDGGSRLLVVVVGIEGGCDARCCYAVDVNREGAVLVVVVEGDGQIVGADIASRRGIDGVVDVVNLRLGRSGVAVFLRLFARTRALSTCKVCLEGMSRNREFPRHVEGPRCLACRNGIFGIQSRQRLGVTCIIGDDEVLVLVVGIAYVHLHLIVAVTAGIGLHGGADITDDRLIWSCERYGGQRAVLSVVGPYAIGVRLAIGKQVRYGDVQVGLLSLSGYVCVGYLLCSTAIHTRIEFRSLLIGKGEV